MEQKPRKLRDIYYDSLNEKIKNVLTKEYEGKTAAYFKLVGRTNEHTKTTYKVEGIPTKTYDGDISGTKVENTISTEFVDTNNKVKTSLSTTEWTLDSENLIQKDENCAIKATAVAKYQPVAKTYFFSFGAKYTAYNAIWHQLKLEGTNRLAVSGVSHAFVAKYEHFLLGSKFLWDPALGLTSAEALIGIDQRGFLFFLKHQGTNFVDKGKLSTGLYRKINQDLRVAADITYELNEGDVEGSVGFVQRVNPDVVTKCKINQNFLFETTTSLKVTKNFKVIANLALSFKKLLSGDAKDIDHRIGFGFEYSV
jgi:hypothetical protein